MSILEKQYPQLEIRSTLKILKFYDTPIELVGTSSLKSQRYPSDFDFMTKITKKYSNTKILMEFQQILSDILNDSTLYFIEFKFQNKSGSKFKLYNPDELNEQLFNKYFDINQIDFIKIDLVININNANDFKEVSCIYFFNTDNKELSIDEYTANLKADQKELFNEHKYYKSLKRLLIIAKINDDLKLMEKLTNLFNSAIGKLYVLKNQLDACMILLETHKKDKLIQKRVEMFLTNNGLKGLKLNKIKDLSNDYDKLINEEGLKFYKENKIKL